MTTRANGHDGASAFHRRALVVRPELDRRASAQASGEALAEAVSLARAIELDVAGGEVARLSEPRPATLLGGGVVERLKRRVAAEEIDLVIIDGPLSPVQQRNLERAWSCKVIDRTGLILEIFAARARTAEGRMQVELAQLTYQKSRLVRTWTHLERQRGGFGFLAGPGETQLESDRRMLTERIAKLTRELDGVKRTRALHRQARKRVPYPVVALVGYTNAGKSTLFNRLVGAGVMAADMLFATLDPTMRALVLPSGRRVILSDTVGFISNLPTPLVAAFRATLEEVRAADLIVHVRDVSHPRCDKQREDVHRVLAELGLGERVDRGLVEALNKVDALDAETRAIIQGQAARSTLSVPISALTGEGSDRLLTVIDEALARAREVVELRVDHGDGSSLAWLHRHAEVLSSAADDEGTRLTVRIEPADLARFESRRPRHQP